MDRSTRNEASPPHTPAESTDVAHNDASVEQRLLANATRQLVLRKARRLAAKTGVPLGEHEEVAQALYQALVRDSATFDPQRGHWLAFAERVLQFASKNLVRHEFAEKRDRRKAVSLQVHVKIDDDEGPTELAQLITREDLDARTGVFARNEVEHSDLRLDVADFKASLSPKLRDLADALERETIQDISRRTGTPRPTLYDRLELLRRAAQDKGLSKYLN